MKTTELLRTALKEFAAEVSSNFAVAGVAPANPEDQLKGPVQTLLKRIGEALGYNVVVRTEAQVADVGGRPDIAVVVDQLLTGYVELKAPGKGARPSRFQGADARQWKRFADLPNLIYTDGQEWALYRNGKRVEDVVRLSGDLLEDGPSAVSARDAEALEALFRVFFGWKPVVPSSPKALAAAIAPLCRLLRNEVLAGLAASDENLTSLLSDWRKTLFADADEYTFADAYAQTLTYAFLLARFAGETDLTPEKTASAIQAEHGLLAEVLRLLTHSSVRARLSVPIELLQRQIAAIDIDKISDNGKGDLWLYFYEDFLAAYDEKLRKAAGVYYTPQAVVSAQVALVNELLEKKFGRPLGVADDNVVVLDPAAGTGTYILQVIKDGLDRVRKVYGEGDVPERASKLAENIYAFEVLVGPYAVCHLRVTQAIRDAGGKLPKDGTHVFLTNTLESPFTEPPGQQQLGFLYRQLAEENKRARHVKSSVPVMVCIGNPPYRREDAGTPNDGGAGRIANWVRFGDAGDEGQGILRDFLKPLKGLDAGVHAKNLYNLYVYFWRWAIWKVLESTNGPGIISFITASSYLRGPGFAGMREVFRRVFDEIWIIDLEGDSIGARKTENVFDIRTPVAIAVGVRYGAPQPDKPAKLWYCRITGTREEKLTRLALIKGFADLQWEEGFDGWAQPFLPRGDGDFFSWPLLSDVFPWQASGVKPGRTWVIAPDPQVLDERWKLLAGAPYDRKRVLFKESPTGRKLNPQEKWISENAPVPNKVSYGFRSFDRQWLLCDMRLIDRPNPVLWRIHSFRQIYLVSMLTNAIGAGPAAVVTDLIPDLHHFRGSYGGKDVIPLWRDREGTVPNIHHEVIETVAKGLGVPVSPEEFLCYSYAILANPSYVERFSEELTIPGPRLPITKNADVWASAVRLGQRLVWLHTFGERMVPHGVVHGVKGLPVGAARCTRAVSQYPSGFDYDEKNQRLLVGDGVFEPVSKEVFEFSISGFPVVRSWLDYRTSRRGARRSSPLDDIQPKQWIFTEELLRLLWVLEETVKLRPQMDAVLDQVLAGPVWTAEELPKPPEELRRPPEIKKQSTGQLSIADGL